MPVGRGVSSSPRRPPPTQSPSSLFDAAAHHGAGQSFQQARGVWGQGIPQHLRCKVLKHRLECLFHCADLHQRPTRILHLPWCPRAHRRDEQLGEGRSRLCQRREDVQNGVQDRGVVGLVQLRDKLRPEVVRLVFQLLSTENRVVADQRDARRRLCTLQLVVSVKYHSAHSWIPARRPSPDQQDFLHKLPRHGLDTCALWLRTGIQHQ